VINSTSTTIKDIDVTFRLTVEFTDQLTQMYDTNASFKLEEDELLQIQKIFEDYAKPRRYFMQIAYDKVVRKETFNAINIQGFNAYIENGILNFAFKVLLEYPLVKNNFLYIKVEDKENFFLIELNKKAVDFANVNKIDKIIDQNSVVFSINSLKSGSKEDQIISAETKDEVKAQTSALSLFTKKIKKNLVDIKNGNTTALFALLFASFLYGIVHALGPGHGKSLAFSYFVANKSSMMKAFVISQASAFVHIVGALILVVISIFVLQSVLNNFVNDSMVILTKVSAVLIILLSLYILYNKWKKKGCACSSCSSTSVQSSWSVNNPQQSVIQTKSVLSQKQDLYFVLTAGMIPCPGTVVLFIYAFILKTYWAVFLASLFISLGMGLVIFISAYLGVGVKNMSEKSHKLTAVLEIAAPIFMLLLGVLLYFNANIF
jgi:ABC-type nickel/cobalt efflux system permease component RcnA